MNIEVYIANKEDRNKRSIGAILTLKEDENSTITEKYLNDKELLHKTAYIHKVDPTEWYLITKRELRPIINDTNTGIDNE